jgi:hypothetical protein
VREVVQCAAQQRCREPLCLTDAKITTYHQGALIGHFARASEGAEEIDVAGEIVVEGPGEFEGEGEGGSEVTGVVEGAGAVVVEVAVEGAEADGGEVEGSGEGAHAGTGTIAVDGAVEGASESATEASVGGEGASQGDGEGAVAEEGDADDQGTAGVGGWLACSHQCPNGEVSEDDGEDDGVPSQGHAYRRVGGRYRRSRAEWSDWGRRRQYGGQPGLGVQAGVKGTEHTDVSGVERACFPQPGSRVKEPAQAVAEVVVVAGQPDIEQLFLALCGRAGHGASSLACWRYSRALRRAFIRFARTAEGSMPSRSAISP